MPRACPVEPHAHSYSTPLNFRTGCHGLAPWRPHAHSYSTPLNFRTGCHGLAPWRPHVYCYLAAERESPRHKAVASEFVFGQGDVAANMNLHGTSPWYPISLHQERVESAEQSGPATDLIPLAGSIFPSTSPPRVSECWRCRRVGLLRDSIDYLSSSHCRDKYLKLSLSRALSRAAM